MISREANGRGELRFPLCTGCKIRVWFWWNRRCWNSLFLCWTLWPSFGW